MTEQEKRTEELAKRYCGSGSSVHCTIDCDGICYCVAYKFAKAAIDANYHKIPEDATVLLVGKDNQALDEKTIEYFVKHNEQVRKETAKEILLDLKYNLETSQPQDVLDGKQCASNDYHNIIGWIDEIAGEYGVEVDE